MKKVMTGIALGAISIKPIPFARSYTAMTSSRAAFKSSSDSLNGIWKRLQY